jgi:lysophospholipase L1-like esterase
MAMKNLRSIFILIACLQSAAAFAQANPVYDADIETIRRFDKMYQCPPHPIVFTGSSSIRKWDHLQQAFGSYNVINRGIGGAVINDITAHVDELIFTYKPREVVLYVGENDLPIQSETTDTILNRTIALFRAIRAKLPDVPVVYIDMKPSPSRVQLIDKCKEANEKIRKFLASEKNVVFVDVFALLLKDGRPRPELFVGDMLHMNPAGYTIWEKAVQPYLMQPEKQ